MLLVMDLDSNNKFDNWASRVGIVLKNIEKASNIHLNSFYCIEFHSKTKFHML